MGSFVQYIWTRELLYHPWHAAISLSIVDIISYMGDEKHCVGTPWVSPFTLLIMSPFYNVWFRFTRWVARRRSHLNVFNTVQFLIIIHGGICKLKLLNLEPYMALHRKSCILFVYIYIYIYINSQLLVSDADSLIILPFHNDFSPSVEQPEQRLSAYTL